MTWNTVYFHHVARGEDHSSAAARADLVTFKLRALANAKRREAIPLWAAEKLKRLGHSDKDIVDMTRAEVAFVILRRLRAST